jgi:anti-anti-sigma factor
MEPDVLTIDLRDQAGVTVIRLAGELDALNVTELTQLVDSLHAEGKRLLVFDLSTLEFIDSAGLGGLVRLWESSVEAGGFLALGQPSSRIREVLHVTGLGNVLKSYDSVEDAVSAVREMLAAFPGKAV